MDSESGPFSLAISNIAERKGGKSKVKRNNKNLNNMACKLKFKKAGIAKKKTPFQTNVWGSWSTPKKCKGGKFSCAGSAKKKC